MAHPIELNEGVQTRWATSVWVIFGRISLLAIYATCLLLTLASVLPRYRWLTEPFAGEQFDFLRMTTRFIPQLGISPSTYALVAISTELLAIGIPLLFATFIFIRRPRSLYPQFCAVMLVATAFTANYPIDAIKFDYPILITVESILQAWAILAGALFMYTFPSGRFEPRWIWVLLVPKAALLLYFLIFPNTPGNYLDADMAWQAPVFAITEVTTSFLIGFFAQLYRYFRVSNATERQQTKWLLFGIAIAWVGWGVRNLAMGVSNLETATVVILIWIGSYLVMVRPIAFGIAIMRYRLWDIERLISLTVVYVTLITAIIAVYLAAIAAFQRIFGSQSPLANAIALVIAALLFQPVRDRLQQIATRYLFGYRDEPIQVLGDLGQRLETVVNSAEILPSIVDTITRSLRVPYAAIALREGDTLTIAAEQGTPSPHQLTLPLTYQGAAIGELRVAQRTATDPFRERDENLLRTVAQQAGAAVHSVRLTRDLRRSRLNLVTAREEERRRIRRDLHDGLGPTLAAQIFRVGAIRNNLHNDLDKSEELLIGLESAIDKTLSDVRRLVYGLRPPLLDQLGLLGAIENHVGGLSTEVNIELDLPELLPLLSAAIEVAAFRIVLTALDNVIQHAQASWCDVTLSAENNQLTISVIDDGIGIGNSYANGIGLSSMRERAEELAGSLSISNAAPNGTRILAVIPIEDGLDERPEDVQ